MKKTFVLFAAAAFALVACESNSPFPGHDEEASGSYFKLISKGSGAESVEEGGAMFIKIKFKDMNDSVFIDVNKESRTPSYPMRIDKAEFAGDFLDMLKKMKTGDSASFYVRLDSLKKYYPDEFVFDPKHDTMKYLGFAVKVDSIYTKSKVDELQAKAKAEQEKQMAMMQKVQEVMGPIQRTADSLAPEIKKKDASLLKPFLTANKITAQPDAEGIYYQELVAGTGDALTPGTMIGVRYVGKYLDGTIFDANTLVEGQDPMYFRIGLDPMIPGFTNSVMKMKKGGKSIFILPSKQGYNDGLTRVFEVELVEVKAAM